MELKAKLNGIPSHPRSNSNSIGAALVRFKMMVQFPMVKLSLMKSMVSAGCCCPPRHPEQLVRGMRERHGADVAQGLTR